MILENQFHCQAICVYFCRRFASKANKGYQRNNCVLEWKKRTLVCSKIYSPVASPPPRADCGNEAPAGSIIFLSCWQDLALLQKHELRLILGATKCSILWNAIFWARVRDAKKVINRDKMKTDPFINPAHWNRAGFTVHTQLCSFPGAKLDQQCCLVLTLTKYGRRTHTCFAALLEIINTSFDMVLERWEMLHANTDSYLNFGHF